MAEEKKTKTKTKTKAKKVTDKYARAGFVRATRTANKK